MIQIQRYIVVLGWLLGTGNAVAQTWNLADQQVGPSVSINAPFNRLLTLENGNLRGYTSYLYFDVSPAGEMLRTFQETRLASSGSAISVVGGNSLVTGYPASTANLHACSIQAADSQGQERFYTLLPGTQLGPGEAVCSTAKSLSDGRLAVLVAPNSLALISPSSGAFTLTPLQVPANVTLTKAVLETTGNRVVVTGQRQITKGETYFWVGLFEGDGTLLAAQSLGEPYSLIQPTPTVFLQPVNTQLLVVWVGAAGSGGGAYSATLNADLSIATAVALRGVLHQAGPSELLQHGPQTLLRFPRDLISFGSAGTFQLQLFSESAAFDSKGRIWAFGCDPATCSGSQLLRFNAQLQLIDEVQFAPLTDATAMAATGAGAMVLTGRSANGSAVSRIESNGALAWHRTLLFERPSGARKVLRSGDAAYVASGDTAHLLRVSATGRILWDLPVEGDPVAANAQGVWVLRNGNTQNPMNCCGLRFVTAAGVAGPELPITDALSSALEVKIASDSTAWLAQSAPTLGRLSHVGTDGVELSALQLTDLPPAAKLRLSGNAGDYFIAENTVVRRYSPTGQLQWAFPGITDYRVLQDDGILVYGTTTRKLNAVGNVAWTITPAPLPFEGNFVADFDDSRAWVTLRALQDDNRDRLLLQRLDLETGVETATESEIPLRARAFPQIILDDHGEAVATLFLPKTETLPDCGSILRFVSDHLVSAQCLNPALTNGRNGVLPWVNNANQLLAGFTSHRSLEVQRASIAIMSELTTDGFE